MSLRAACMGPAARGEPAEHFWERGNKQKEFVLKPLQVRTSLSSRSANGLFLLHVCVSYVLMLHHTKASQTLPALHYMSERIKAGLMSLAAPL